MNSIYSSALYGINNANLQMTAAASNVSQTFVTDSKAIRVENNQLVQTSDTIELSNEALQMIQAKVGLKASANVVQTYSEVQQSLIDILA